MVTFVCSDNRSVSVDNSVIAHEGFGLLEDFAQGDNGSSEAIPLPNIDGAVFEKVIEWCTYHKDDEQHSAEDIKSWDEQYISSEYKMLFAIILAANYLSIKPLLDLGCRQVAKNMRGKTPGEICTMFKIVPSAVEPE